MSKLKHQNKQHEGKSIVQEVIYKPLFLVIKMITFVTFTHFFSCQVTPILRKMLRKHSYSYSQAILA